MSTMYSTITSKGQITLPASLRSRLGLKPGLKVSMREAEGSIVIDAPRDMESLRAEARAEMLRAGTLGTVIDASGWAQAVAYKADPTDA